MECSALVDPQQLAELISELDDTKLRSVRDAYVCDIPAQNDPGRKQLWIVPMDAKLGANHNLWIKTHQELLDEVIDRSIGYATIIFAGSLPAAVERRRVDVHRVLPDGTHRLYSQNIRIMSGPAHVWIDRLRVHDAEGYLDRTKREQQLRRWVGKHWRDEDENSYIVPNLQMVQGSEERVAKKAQEQLLANKPSCPDSGLAIIYGQGGVGKTFFLSRVAHLLSRAAQQDITSSIPVFMALRGILHADALETSLSHNGGEHLSLRQLTTLVRRGVVTPILDALDEVVKGEARKGGEEFLSHIFGLAEAGTLRGMLACRDYYLTADRGLVCDRAFERGFAQLYIGPFSHQDTRKYIQVRTGLEPKDAKRWTDALETEAKKVVGEDADLEVIRHPVVLKTLAEYIKKLPDDSRVAASAEFKLTRTEIFGDIVDELLKRERDKHFVGWDRAFQGQLVPEWRDPFEFPKQRQLLRKLTLLSAQAGGSRGLGRDSGVRHGLFLGSKGVPAAANGREALENYSLTWSAHQSPARAYRRTRGLRYNVVHSNILRTLIPDTS